MKRRPVLVTVSGMVGTGKSTAVKHLVHVIESEGVNVAYWRFQRLPCITLRPNRERSGVESSPRSTPTTVERGGGYRSRPLTAFRTLGYVVRMLAFRVFHRWPRSARWAVSNRYFYDSVAHYDIDGPVGRLYATLLRRLMVKPDLAFLMVASRETLLDRRPQYSIDYIANVDRGYRGLRVTFPELIEINSEQNAGALDRMEAVVRELLAPNGHRKS